MRRLIATLTALASNLIQPAYSRLVSRTAEGHQKFPDYRPEATQAMTTASPLIEFLR